MTDSCSLSLVPVEGPIRLLESRKNSNILAVYAGSRTGRFEFIAHKMEPCIDLMIALAKNRKQRETAEVGNAARKANASFAGQNANAWRANKSKKKKKKKKNHSF